MNLTTTTDSDFESDLVFMADALDAWFQLSPTTLIARYDELNTTGVVVGAEKTCWPNEWGVSASSTLLRSITNIQLLCKTHHSPHVRTSQTRLFPSGHTA